MWASMTYGLIGPPDHRGGLGANRRRVLRDPHKSRTSASATAGGGAWNKVVKVQSLPLVSGGHHPKGQRHRREPPGEKQGCGALAPSAPPWFGRQPALDGAAARLPWPRAHAPVQSLPKLLALVFVQPGRRVSWARQGQECVQAPSPPGCCVTRCLPPGLWEPGDTPVGCREWRLWSAWSRHLRGRAVALHVRQAGASPPLPSPYPAPPPFPVALRLPQGPASRPLHTRGPRVPLCGASTEGGGPPGLPRRQAALGRAEARPGCRGHGPGADRYSGRLAPRRPGVHAEAWWVPDTEAQRGARLGRGGRGSYPTPPGPEPVGAGWCGSGGAGERHPGPRASLGALTSDLGRTV